MLTKLGKYQIKSEIGSGAMGVVYRAEDSRLGRPVALKTMSARMAGDAELLRRFYREAQSAGKLRHPNIVTIYDIDEADGIPFIAMEFLEGDSLEKIINTRKELPLVKKLDITLQTCRGLHYAHQHGVIHRDVKPANVMVLEDGLVKLVDFGIARVGSTSMTRTGMVLGTPTYMAPEQIRGAPVDARSDVFSIGVICYELLTYISPFSAEDVPTILYKIMNETPASLIGILPNCPPELDRVVMRAIAKDREERYQSAEDFAFDLQQLSDSVGRHMLDVYVLEGQRSFEAGNLTLAKESFQKALEIDSGHHLAKNLLEQVQHHLYIRQRGQKMEECLDRAQEAIKVHHYDEAIVASDEVLLLEPQHPTALQLKQFAAERRSSVQKVVRHMERAEKYLAEADFRSAKAELDALLKMDPKNSAALRRLDEVVKELKEQERLRHVRQQTENARGCLGEKNFAKAIELLEQAGSIDPMNLEVEALLRLARSGQEEAARRQVLLDRQAEIEEALNREHFEEALKLAEQALEQFPDNPHVAKLHTRAVRLAVSYRKRKHVDAQLEAARDFLQQNRYPEAIELLQQTLETLPDDPRLTTFLRTVQETQARAAVEAMRRQVIREANDLIRRQDFTAAIAALDRAFTTAGHSPELDDLLQFAREQQAEQHQQERRRQILARAQSLILQENLEEATRVLERGQSELKSDEIESLMSSVRQKQQEFEHRRVELLEQADQLLQAHEPTRAIALLDAAPQEYFKNEEFKRVYAQSREAVDRLAALRATVEQIEKHLAGEKFHLAEPLLREALKRFPNEPDILAAQKRLQEEQTRYNQAQWTKALDQARVAIARMDYERAVKLLGSVDWEASGLPALAAEATTLHEEALRGTREREAQRREQEGVARRREEELAQRQPIPAKDLTPWGPTVAGAPQEPDSLPGRSLGESEAPRGQPQFVRPAGKSTAEPPAQAFLEHPPIEAEQPVAARSQPFRIGLVLAGALVVVTLLIGAWRFLGHGGERGIVELNATPWADVVSVETISGEHLTVTGQTPLQLSLPANEYVIQLKRGDVIQRTSVAVKPGEMATINFTFPEVKVDEVVDELVSKY